MALDTLDVLGIHFTNVKGFRAKATTDVSDKSYLRPQGSETYTDNNTYDVTELAEVVVDVSGTAPTIESLSVTPTTSQQTFNSASVDGYKPVVVSAMPSGSVAAPSTISGTSANISTGTNTLTLSKTVSVTPNVTTAGYISNGTAGNSSVSLTASVTTKAAATITPGTSNQTIASGTYLTGTQTISGDADLVAANIKTGVNIFNVAGTFTADANAAATDIKSGKTAYVGGSKITGTLVTQNYYTGSTTPASSLGNNGDIYLKVS